MTSEDKSGATDEATKEEEVVAENEQPDEEPARKKSRMRWISTPLSLLSILIVTMILAAFVRFAEDVSSLEKSDDLTKADAIVVLTGGQKRITEAVKLFETGVGDKLFISGVNPDISNKELQRVSGADQKTFDCCIALGREAKDTIGNATEIAQWANENEYKQLVVVTSNYHMIRSLYLLRSVSNDISFLPYPVMNTDLKSTNWVENTDVIRALINEFAKLNFAYIRKMISPSQSA